MAESMSPQDADLQAWFHQHWDPILPPGTPFDRERWLSATLPKARGLANRAHWNPWGLALGTMAAAMVAVAVGLHPGLTPKTATAGASTPHTPPQARASLAAPYAPRWIAPANFPDGATSVTITRTRLLAGPGPHSDKTTWTNSALIGQVIRTIRQARPVAPGTYNCPADNGVSYQMIFHYPGGADAGIQWDPTGCRWLTLFQGSANPVVRGAPSLLQRVTYWVPSRLPSLVEKHLPSAMQPHP